MPSRVVSDVAEVLAAEITELTDYVVEASGRMIQTRTSRRGKLRDVELFIATPSPVDVDHHWKAPDRPSQSTRKVETSAPTDIANVASIQTSPRPPMRARPLPGETMPTPKQADDAEEIPF